MRNAFASLMKNIGEYDKKLVVLIGDISHFILQPFAEACPGRFYNIGILEPTIVSMSAGLYHTGFYPVAHTIAPFLTERSLEQIKLDFCYQELGGNLVTVGSAFDYAGLGCTHHCYDDIGILKNIPRTEIVYPAMPKEFEIIFKKTYRNDKLTYFRLPEHKHNVDIDEKKIIFGKAIILKSGKDITIIAAGPQLKTVMNALPSLKNIGIDPEIIYVPTIKPFDYETVGKSVKKTGKFVVIEEHMEFGGVGDEVLRCVEGVLIKNRIFLNIPNNFIHYYGSYEEICNKLGLTPKNLIKTIKAICKK